MSVAKVTEITAESAESFEDAIRNGIARANRTLEGVQSAWIKEQQVVVDPNSGKVQRYRVNMKITFLLRE